MRNKPYVDTKLDTAFVYLQGILTDLPPRPLGNKGICTLTYAALCRVSENK